jgi:phospholipase A1
MKHSGTALVALALLSVLATQAKAADEPAVCRALDDDASRLACYDRAAGRARPGVAAPASTPDAAMVTAAASPPPVPAPTTRNWWTGGTYTPQTFAERWELDPGTKDGVFKIKAYQPTYVMVGNWRKNTNPNPCSPNPQNCASGQEAYMHGDAKFQISAKTKLWQDIFDSPAGPLGSLYPADLLAGL